jgi:putative sigma-54 modulation protein
MAKLEPRISRAEVFLKEDHDRRIEPRTCGIRLSIYGDTLYVNRNAGTFEEAAEKAMTRLGRLVRKILKSDEELPEDQTSTVKI